MFRRWITGLLLLGATSATAADKLIIISPHRKSIQQEYVPAFEAYYKKKFKKEVQVDWLDQGGTSDDLRFVKAKFAKNPKTSGVDIFWGGGTSTFLELQGDKLLQKYEPAPVKNGEVPKQAAGIALYDNSKTWFASAISSFGIFYNRKVLAMEKMPEPKTWEDLTNPKYRDNISLTDPRRSGTANTMNNIVIKSLGWEKGWEMLTAIAGNTRSFTHSSSDPIKSVVSGDTALAMAIDFYALAKVGDLGQENLGFVMPEGKTIIDPDPAAILKGAPNRQVAQRFMDFILSKEAQKLLILPKGAPDGPKFSTLGRMAINKQAYEETNGRRTSEVNPFKQKGYLTLDMKAAGEEKAIFDDLYGALIIDTHSELKKAWATLTRKGLKPEKMRALGKPPISQAEFKKYAKKWNDDVFRNKKINEWVAFARKKYNEQAAH